MSPETYLKIGERVRIVTLDEAREICGEPRGEEKVFDFPEYGTTSEGDPYTLGLTESFLKLYGGTVVTIARADRSFGGAHIHYSASVNYELETGDAEDNDSRIFVWSFCPTMFSEYAEEEYEIDPLEQDYVEGLFGSLFFT